MRILKIDSPFAGYQAYRFEGDNVSFTAYEKDFGHRFILEDTFDEVAPYHRLIVPPHRDADNQLDEIMKWDTILQKDFKLDPMDIRPKKGNLYQRLEPAYDGVHLYFKLLKEPENDDVAHQLETLRVSQSFHHALERYTFDQSEYQLASATQESSERTLEQLEKTHQNSVDRLKKEKATMVPDEEKLNLLTEKIYIYKTKIKRTKRRIERAIKRSEKAAEDLKIAKTRLDLLEKLMREKYKQTPPKQLDEKPILQQVEKPVLKTKPFETKLKETPVIQKTIEPKIEKPVSPPPAMPTPLPVTPFKNTRNPWGYWAIIAILLGIIGGLLMTRPQPFDPSVCPEIKQATQTLPTVQIQETECPAIEAVAPCEACPAVQACEVCPDYVAEHIEKPVMEPIRLEEPTPIVAEDAVGELIEQLESKPAKTMTLDALRAAYRRGVLHHQTQAPFDFEAILTQNETDFMQNEEPITLETLEEMNALWNALRQETYAVYYQADRELKPEVLENTDLYDQFLQDEKILRFYAEKYQASFVKIATDFLAQHSDCPKDLKSALNKQIKQQGHPQYKMKLLKKISQFQNRT